MNCAEIKSLLSGYLDGELEFTRSFEVASHLKSCPACQAHLESLKLLSEKVQTHVTVFELPEELRLKVVPSVEIEPGRRSRWFWPGFAAGLVACSLTVIFVTTIFHTQSDVEALDAVSLHLHSLQEGHLIDVASSDHHVVKPWLAGKLNFTFDPEDYAADGFKLLGARLEYFEGEPAVALVYKCRDHIINLLVQKDIFKKEFQLQSDVNGFHIRAWKKQELRYIAISDIATKDLEKLQSLVLAHN